MNFETLCMSKTFCEEINRITCFVCFYQTTKSPKIGRFPPYWIQKKSSWETGTSKLLTSTWYLGHSAFAHLSLHSLYWTWNVSGRYVVGGCGAFQYMQKSIVLHAIPFPIDNDWSKELEVDRFRKAKADYMRVDPKLVNMLQALHERRLHT